MEGDVEAVANAVMNEADGYGEVGLVTVSEMRSFTKDGPYEPFSEWCTSMKNWTLHDLDGDGAFDFTELSSAVRAYLKEKVGGNLASGCAFSPEVPLP